VRDDRAPAYNIWLLSMPACAEVNSAKLELLWVNYNTDKQYRNIIDARRACDIKDTYIVFNYLLEKEPFCQACAVSPPGSMYI